MEDIIQRRGPTFLPVWFLLFALTVTGCARVQPYLASLRTTAPSLQAANGSRAFERTTARQRQAVGPVVRTAAERGQDKHRAVGPILQPIVQISDAPRVLTPEEVVVLALSANPDLETARQQVAHASAVLSYAEAQWYPQVRVEQRYAVTDNPNQVFAFLQNQGRLSLGTGGLASAANRLNNPTPTDNFLTQLRLEQSLYSGGRRQAETRAAESRHDASRFALASVQNELVFHVLEAYYRLLQARELVEVRREAVEQIKRHLKNAQSRHHVGTAVKSDVLAFQVRLAEVEEQLISARNRTKLAWAVLENVTGIPLDGWGLPETIPEARWAGRFDRIETAVAEALRQRPEVFELEQESQAAEHEIRVAEAGKRATVDVLGSYEVYTGDLDRGQDNFFVGLAVGLNLFDAGRTASAERQAKAKLCRLRSQSQRLLLNIELAVRQAHLQLEDARQRAEVTARGLSHADESLREIEARYLGEMATITEMLDAQVARSDARVRDLKAQADVQLARTALSRAVGRLVDAFVS